MQIEDIQRKVRQKPLTVTAIVFILLFWILAPLIAQKYYGYSAISVSFLITVVYFIIWKVYENREKFPSF